MTRCFDLRRRVMNSFEQTFNFSPCWTDWRRYHSPTVLRRQGRGFLERLWKPEQHNQEQHPLSKSELEILVASYGGLILPIPAPMLVVFLDYHWARRCQHLLNQRGVPAQRTGCHLQLPEL
jgi:hypothetical protein